MNYQPFTLAGEPHYQKASMYRQKMSDFYERHGYPVTLRPEDMPPEHFRAYRSLEDKYHRATRTGRNADRKWGGR